MWIKFPLYKMCQSLFDHYNSKERSKINPKKSLLEPKSIQNVIEKTMIKKGTRIARKSLQDPAEHRAQMALGPRGEVRERGKHLPREGGKEQSTHQNQPAAGTGGSLIKMLK